MQSASDTPSSHSRRGWRSARRRAAATAWRSRPRSGAHRGQKISRPGASPCGGRAPTRNYERHATRQLFAEVPHANLGLPHRHHGRRRLAEFIVSGCPPFLPHHAPTPSRPPYAARFARARTRRVAKVPEHALAGRRVGHDGGAVAGEDLQDGRQPEAVCLLARKRPTAMVGRVVTNWVFLGVFLS